LNAALPYLLHQTGFGALAAGGFGILFNFGWRELSWCAASGALALATRTLGLDCGWSLEMASFMAAATVGSGAWLLRQQLDIAGNALAVAGCIPMIPGSFAAQAIFGLFALTAPHPDHAAMVVASTMEYMLRVAFTIGAIGAGLSITTSLPRRRKF
jgi:uncharacterized membrane protein YjjB (DUF3815 family)